MSEQSDNIKRAYQKTRAVNNVDTIIQLAFSERVAPVAERPLGELHDVALVDDRDAPAPMPDRILERGPQQPLAALA